MGKTITTLARAHVPIRENDSLTLSQFLETALRENRGCVGFGEHIIYVFVVIDMLSRTVDTSCVPDSDDTANAIMALHHLGRSVSVDTLIREFESHNHFRTYAGERNPSFTSNCNVLMCLCMLENPIPYSSQIAKAANYICSQAVAGNVKDKWVSDNIMTTYVEDYVKLILYNTSSTSMTSTG